MLFLARHLLAKFGTYPISRAVSSTLFLSASLTIVFPFALLRTVETTAFEHPMRLAMAERVGLREVLRGMILLFIMICSFLLVINQAIHL